jgi:hypothetical protein
MGSGNLHAYIHVIAIVVAHEISLSTAFGTACVLVIRLLYQAHVSGQLRVLV